MAITYTWTFPQFDTAPSAFGETNVVTTIHWRYTAVDNDHTLADGTHPTASAYGTVGCGEPDGQNFIPFANLTKDWAIAHITAQHPQADLETALAAQIAAIINPPIVPMQPPFGA